MKLTQQIWRFILTGGVNTAFGYVIYAFGVIVFDLSYFWAVIFSYILGTIFSYFTFRTFVFTDGDRSWRSFTRFIPAYVVMMVINIVALHILVDIGDWNRLIAQAALIPFLAVLSFFVNRIFVFRK